MTTYFQTTYRAPTKQVAFSSVTAIYVGPNPPALPPGQAIGKPVVWTPPADLSVEGAVGTAAVPYTVRDANGENPTASTLDIPMTQQEAASLGNVLAYAVCSGCALVMIYTGGVVISSWNEQWTLPAIVNAKAPNSANFAKVFTNLATWLIENPLPSSTPNPPQDAQTDAFWATVVVIGLFTGGLPGLVVMGVGGLGYVLTGDTPMIPPFYVQVDVVGPIYGGDLSDPISSVEDAGVNWADGSQFDGFGDIGDFTANYNQSVENWEGWGD